jgi:undecaprenyl-diphosphatase
VVFGKSTNFSNVDVAFTFNPCGHNWSIDYLIGKCKFIVYDYQMDYVQAVILSVIEGLAEFLPISSTGHLILASDLLKIVQTDFVKSFEIIIQLGAILAVVVLYWKKFLDTKLWPIIISGFIPTAIFGFIFYKTVKNYLLGNSLVVVIALFLGGILLILIEKFLAKNGKIGQINQTNQIGLKKAALIGVFQSVSIIPGVSRSASTIIGGLICNLDRKTAIEFSFLLAIPTMFAASALDIYQTKLNFTQQELICLSLGFIGAFITAIFAIKFFLKFVQNHTFIPFGIYRIIIAIVFWFIFLT